MITLVDYEITSKRRLYSALGWVVVALWVIFNFSMAVSGLPFAVLLIMVPIINVLLIITWFVTRTFYNVWDSKLKHAKKMELYVGEKPIPQYGEGNGAEYIPNITISSELFKKVSSHPDEAIALDISLKDYLKPGKMIVFHDEVDYGARKKVEVKSVKIGKKEIEAFFSLTQQ